MPSAQHGVLPSAAVAAPPPRLASRRQVWLALAVLALLTLAAFWRSLDAPFYLDDYSKIVKNRDIHSLRALPRTLVYPYDREKPSFQRNDPSRPLVYLSFALNYQFGKDHPRGYHVVNLALHLLAAVLLFFLLRVAAQCLFHSASVLAPLCGALLFALHPVNAGTVSYVFCRSDLLAVSFMLAALLLFQVRGRWARPAYAGALVAFALALASKQSAIVLPALALCLAWLLHGEGWRAAVRARRWQHAGLWVVALAYLGLRLVVLSGLGDLEGERPWPRDEYLFIQPYTLVRYLQFLFMPVGLSFVHHVRLPNTVFDPRVIYSLLGLAALLLGLWWLARRQGAVGRAVLFFTLWLLIALAPTSSIFPTTSPLVENRLYLPSVAFALLAMVLGLRLADNTGALALRRRLTLAAAVICVGLFVVITFTRCSIYREPLRLWGEVIGYYPHLSWAHAHLGSQYLNQLQYDHAEQEYLLAIAIDPTDAVSYSNLGILYVETKQWDKALYAVKTALRLRPSLEEGHLNLGMLYGSLGEQEKAVEAFETALGLNPDSLQAHAGLASLYAYQGRWADAERANFAVLRLTPGEIRAYNNLSFVYWQQHRYADAERMLLTMLRIDPASVDAYHNLALLYAETGDQARRQWAEERLRALQGQR